MSHPGPAPSSRAAFDAVIFDMDGVLVESEPWWHEVRVALAAAHGLEWTHEDTRHVSGPNSAGWAQIMRERRPFPIPEDAIMAAVIDGLVRRYALEPAPRIDGAEDAVRRIATTHPVGLASSSARPVIDATLRALGLREAFTVVVSGDEVAHGKPSPDVYLLAAERLGAAPGRCLVVEDSINGVRAAHAAGMTVVLVPSARVPAPPEAHRIAHYVLPRLADLDPGALPARGD